MSFLYLLFRSGGYVPKEIHSRSVTNTEYALSATNSTLGPGFLWYAWGVQLLDKGAIQVLRNADGGEGVSSFPGKNVTKV